MRHSANLACFLTCVFALAALALYAWAAGTPALQAARGQEARKKAARAILDEHDRLIVGLIVQAAERVEPSREVVGDAVWEHYPYLDAKHASVILLGDLRAREAVPVLMENLTYFNPKLLNVMGYELGAAEGPGWYPAVESLIKIGMPSVEPVVKRLARFEEDCLERRLCVVIIRGILGDRLAEARLRIPVEEAEKAAAEDPSRALARGALPPDKARLETTIRNLQAAVSVLHAQETIPVGTVEPIW